MRSASLVALLALAVVVAGCGGSQLDAHEVPGPPPTIALPGGDAQTAGAADADADAETDEDAGADADADAGATDAGGAAAAPPSDTGAAAPPTSEPAAPESAPQQDPAETGGADADAGLDQFCADNPGAC